MRIVNGTLQLHLRNEDGALEVYHLSNLADLSNPKFNDLDPLVRQEAVQLLQQIEASPAYQADMESAVQDMLNRQQERKANKRKIVVKVVPRT